MRKWKLAIMVCSTLLPGAILITHGRAQPPSSSRLRLELFADDLSKTVDFYTGALGFELVRKEKGYASVRLGAVEFGLGTVDGLPASHYFRPEIATQRRGLGTEIVIEVNDVNAIFENVKRSGVKILTPLAKRPWGLTDFRIADPDGYYLRISSST